MQANLHEMLLKQKTENKFLIYDHDITSPISKSSGSPLSSRNLEALKKFMGNNQSKEVPIES